MNNLLKVLYLTNIPSPYRIDFFNELGKSCDLTVTFEGVKATDRDGNWVGDGVKNFTATYLNGIRTGVDSFLCFDIIKVLKEEWDSIIVGGYSTPTSILAIEYMRLRNINFIVQADGGFIKKDTFLKYLIKKHLISKASVWLSTSDMTTDYLVHYGASREKCFKYPFTSITSKDICVADEMLLKKEYFKNKLNLNEDKVIITVGRFTNNTAYRKGYDILMKCAEGLDKSIGIYIIGDDPTQEFIEWKKRKELTNLHFIGFKTKTELQEYYAAADLFILMTREDIWGLVINEAIAFGLPVITTDKCIAGIELVKNDINGYVISSEDVEGLKKKVDYLFNNESRLIQFGKQSRKIAQNYTIELMAEAHVKILRKYNGNM